MNSTTAQIPNLWPRFPASPPRPSIPPRSALPLRKNVPDLDVPEASLGVLVDVDVDGEMGIDVAHLVLEALCHTDNQVVDEGSDGAESGDVLAVAVVDLNADDVLLRRREADGDVAKVLGERAAGALDRHEARLDQHLDYSGRSACIL